MKGISPVVAVVIMIAVAVIVGVMVSTWVTHWVSTQTETTPTCAIKTQYIVDSATYTASTGIWRIKITNKGSEGIYGFQVEVHNSTDITKYTSPTDSYNTSSTNKLPQGASLYLSFTGGNGNVTDTATEIRVLNAGCPSVSEKTESITQA